MNVRKVLLSIAFAVAAPGLLHAAPAKKLVIGMAFQEMNNPYFVVMREALEEAGQSLGATVITTDARHDVNKQVSDIEDMINQKINILLINPADSVGVKGAVEAAKKAGVIVVAVDAQAQGPLDSFVGSKNYDAGLQAGLFMGKYLNGKGKVAILDGIPVVPILERVRGFKDSIKKFPGIHIVDTQNGKQERDIAMEVTENMIQKTPDLVGIFSVNDGGALGSMAAIQASKKNIALVSVDGAPEAVKAILANTVFKCTVAQYQVRIAIGIALSKYWGAHVPSTVPVDVTTLTASNAKGFSW